VELETAQRSQTIYIAAREADANPNHWYAIARVDKLKPGKILTAKFWNQPLAVFRDETDRFVLLMMLALIRVWLCIKVLSTAAILCVPITVGSLTEVVVSVLQFLT
jgi:hypothetical protein